MRYQTYQAQADLAAQLRFMLHTLHGALSSSPLKRQPFVKRVAAIAEVLSAGTISHARPDFSIGTVKVSDSADTRLVAPREVAVKVKPFGTLLHFQKDGVEGQPRVLLVAPLSGHFSTLMRETVRTMLADHDVFITDWHNARDVPLSAGRFGMDEYVRYLISYLDAIGPGAHMVAVCQPCVAALTALAVMAAQGHSAQPRTLTLMAGPIDARINPTTVNKLAMERPLHWFESNLIGFVPLRHQGALRRVYPGFMQLSAFLNMNLERHLNSFKELYRCLLAEEEAKAAAIRTFYREYFAVLDLTAEFYLETIRRVFQEHALPQGRMTWQGRRVDPGVIQDTALLTVEGERDDICGIGQTMAAHALCAHIPPYMKRHHMQVGAGHYGVFSGRRWEQQIYPVVRDLIYCRR